MNQIIFMKNKCKIFNMYKYITNVTNLNSDAPTVEISDKGRKNKFNSFFPEKNCLAKLKSACFFQLLHL